MQKARWFGLSLWHKLTGTALVLVLLLTACTSEMPPAAAPVQDDPSEEGQTITVINPESSENQGNPAATSAENKNNRYQIQTRLTDFQLLSATTGLAWGNTRNELRLYITEDNGKTWTNISPAASVPFSTTPEYGKDIFFLIRIMVLSFVILRVPEIRLSCVRRTAE